MESDPRNSIDFTNTEVAFSTKSDKELKKMSFLFNLMNKGNLVNMLSSIGLKAIQWRLPFAQYVFRKTIFDQFVGGENLLDCQTAIDKLYKFDALTILDYGAEGKSSEEELNNTMQETIRAIEFAAANSSVPCVSTKITGLVDNAILENYHNRTNFDSGEQRRFDQLIERISQICSRAESLGVGIFIDAEETWIQDAIDDIADQMMQQYNTQNVVVYNTFQMYRKDRLDFLHKSHQLAKEKGFLLGAKLVRGAYMDKERQRAEENGYPSPINDTKQDTDDLYNKALRYCLDHYEEIGFCNASHNVASNQLLASLIAERSIDKSHSHINFCQLYGMSDYITFNLAEAGYNVAKYMPYGPVKEVVPYLIRRAKENSTVTGEVSRELSLIQEEMKRRGL